MAPVPLFAATGVDVRTIPSRIASACTPALLSACTPAPLSAATDADATTDSIRTAPSILSLSLSLNPLAFRLEYRRRPTFSSPATANTRHRKYEAPVESAAHPHPPHLLFLPYMPN
jgi:hypothetical protein